MAVDAFLQFSKPDINGESRDASFGQGGSLGKPPAFEITKWSFGASNTATIGSATGGAGGGKAEFDSFSVTKNLDTASPALFLTSCVGGHYQMVTLSVRKAGGSQGASGAPYLVWQFKMVFVEQISWSSGDEQPTEDVKFKYGAIQFAYSKQDSTGKITPAGTSIWSQVLNSNDFETGY